MVNIKVAVRIRPLSEREVLRGEEISVRKENKTILVTNPKIPEKQDGDGRQRTRRFTVDFCYDSREPEGTQEAVYNEIGREVLCWMYEGYNACVLAYGHSASGKTHTIMGSQDDPGLTPRLSEGLFDLAPEGRIQVQVFVSFLEIYNEKVRDLLGGEETGATCGSFSLRVREHPKLGPYVQGLSEHRVTDKTKLLQLLTAGNRRRSTAATESNAYSSRSHAVFTVHLKQSDGENLAAEKWSKVHMVDLAGSERARSSQSKARLQEGANINKSLATLGNVISALAESFAESGVSPTGRSASKTWQPFVPYRDSVLTWLLKDTLGGNSNTIMIATVSPASSCIGETVNTLRYAKRAKKIVNRPVVNEDPKVRTIRELRKEIARLRGLLTFLRSVKGDDHNKKETRDEKNGDQEAETVEKTGGGEERKREGDGEGKGKEKATGGRKAGGVRGGDARGIDDEKKSDVNGSVNDNFSHEAQFFSDSLESFSSVLPKSGTSCDADDDASRKPETGDDEFEMRGSGGRSLASGINGEFGSRENLSRESVPEMLHRSRPDLIKGISTRARDNGLPPGSSHSWTDVSNLSHSTSENSLNSSGSADVQPAESRPPRNPPTSREAPPGKREKGTGKDGGGNGASGVASQKKEKRLEIVEAVTSRLYVARKKLDRKTEVPKKEENDDDCGDLDELKLCKRARMKLFDLSRKLAMNRKMRKTVDSDTQTECATGTLRVKEKSVTTEPSTAEIFEAATAEETCREEKKPYVIMNQVFIPRASNYVVECGDVVRVGGPEGPARHESATQTSGDGKRCHNGASPAALSPREEDSFSDDSLDSEAKAAGGREAPGGKGAGGDDPPPEVRMRFEWPANFEICLFPDSRNSQKEGKLAEDETADADSGDRAFDDPRSLPTFGDGAVDSPGRSGFFLSEVSRGVPEWRETNLSSEDSFASVEVAERNSWNEVASEDFEFYENPKDVQTGGKASSDRELYTITENSEQSDPGDAFSPVQRRCLSFGAPVEQGPSRRKPSGNRRRGSRDGAEEQEAKADFPRTFDFPETARDEPKVPKSTFSPTGDALPETTDRPPNAKTARRPSENPEVGPGGQEGKPDVRRRSADSEERGERAKWSDFPSDSQRHYLNLNIGGDGGGRAAPFSVDSHLFGKASRTDRSTDAMSTSAESITFVFMGPAKPKTSFLMEIIGRSLGRRSPPSDVSFGQKKSRSRGVQCDAGLMRSVSVDTAMIALSRIARNREGQVEMQRTTSLGKLNSEEALEVQAKGNLDGGVGSGCRCETERGYLKGERQKCSVKYSVGTSTGTDDDDDYDDDEAKERTKRKKADAEKRKKSVSWVEESREDGRTNWRGAQGFRPRGPEGPGADFLLALAGGTDEDGRGLKPRGNGDSELHERRVRFLKAKTWDFAGDRRGESEDDFTTFLREATQLLKNLNSRSSKQSVFSEEGAEDSASESSRKKKGEESRKGGQKMSKKADSSGKSKAAEKEGDGQANLTWPRRRGATGKPPTGTRARLPPRPEPLRPGPRSWSPGSRIGSVGQSWNLSNLSVALGNSCFGERDVRLPGSRSWHWNETGTRADLFPPAAAQPKRTNFGAASDLETDLEECCRRLELATEQDRAREELLEKRNKGVLPTRGGAEDRGPTEATRRWKGAECAGGCACRGSGQEPCRRLWSRGCRSSFELDSFGPGSNHCHQRCMFCRKKETETFYSAVSLNSECSSGLCRLNYYGFCPCSPIKLNQVASSPRAYMQRLLALRKRIVRESKDSGEEGRPGSQRGRAELSPASG